MTPTPPDLAHKRVIIGRRKPGTTLAERSLPTSTRVKLIGGVQRAASASAEAFKLAWADAGRIAGADKLQRHVQNDTLPGPAGPAPLDGIDEYWFEDEASARAGLKQWQAALGDALVRPGLITDPGHFARLAHEQVLFAGPGRA